MLGPKGSGRGKLTRLAQLLAADEFVSEAPRSEQDAPAVEAPKRARGYAAKAAAIRRARALAVDTFWLWPEHVPVLDLWTSVRTQWRYSEGERTGLDYVGVRASPVFRAIRGRRQREETFSGLVVMEHAWIAERNRRAAARAAQQG